MIDRTENQLSPLQHLPAEIRNHIFTLVVVYGDLDIRSVVIQPAVAATNLKIRNEVLPIFFGANRFMVELKKDQSDRDSLARISTMDHFYARYLKLISVVGVYFSSCHPMLPDTKLYVFLRNDSTLGVRFEGIHPDSQMCLCHVKKVMRKPNGNGNMTLAGRCLRACAIDIQMTRYLIKTKVRDTVIFPRYPPCVSYGDCRECEEFRKSVEFSEHKQVS